MSGSILAYIAAAACFVIEILGGVPLLLVALLFYGLRMRGVSVDLAKCLLAWSAFWNTWIIVLVEGPGEHVDAAVCAASQPLSEWIEHWNRRTS